jgi:hypothetical protein
MIWVPNLEDIQSLLIKTRRKRKRENNFSALPCPAVTHPGRVSLSLSLSPRLTVDEKTNQSTP